MKKLRIKIVIISFIITLLYNGSSIAQKVIYKTLKKNLNESFYFKTLSECYIQEDVEHFNIDAIINSLDSKKIENHLNKRLDEVYSFIKKENEYLKSNFNDYSFNKKKPSVIIEQNGSNKVSLKKKKENYYLIIDKSVILSILKSSLLYSVNVENVQSSYDKSDSTYYSLIENSVGRYFKFMLQINTWPYADFVHNETDSLWGSDYETLSEISIMMPLLTAVMESQFNYEIDFLLSHEIGHILLNHHEKELETCDIRNSIEFEADLFAYLVLAEKNKDIIKAEVSGAGLDFLNLNFKMATGFHTFFYQSYFLAGFTNKVNDQCKYPSVDERINKLSSINNKFYNYFYTNYYKDFDKSLNKLNPVYKELFNLFFRPENRDEDEIVKLQNELNFSDFIKSNTNEIDGFIDNVIHINIYKPHVAEKESIDTQKEYSIFSRVAAIIVDKLGVDEADVTLDASFTNDLGADSLDTVELIMEFEKEFNIAIPDSDAENIATVGDVIDYLKSKGIPPSDKK